MRQQPLIKPQQISPQQKANTQEIHHKSIQTQLSNKHKQKQKAVIKHRKTNKATAIKHQPQNKQQSSSKQFNMQYKQPMHKIIHKATLLVKTNKPIEHKQHNNCSK